MKPTDIIEEKINKKETFSIHSIMNEFKLEILDAKKVIKLAIENPKLHKYFICICPKCGNKCGDGIFDSSLYGKSRKCYSCQNEFKTSDKNIELIFDSKSLKDRLNLN
jgi:hypothetical protein